MTARRVSWWTRWPDGTEGPLHVGLHADERGGSCVIVGVEVWTQPPGTARTDPGPVADPAEELAHSAPQAVQKCHLDLPLSTLWTAFADALAEGAPELAELLRASRTRTGRPPLYDRAHYEAVAGLWLREGTAGVVAHYTVSSSVARGWVLQCRRLELLDAS